MAKPLITAQQVGNCYTLFHECRGRSVEDVTVPQGYGQAPIINGNETETLRVEISQQEFQPNEILRMRVDFHPKEYTSLNEPVYGTITIHDPTESPDTRKRRYLIHPGNYYEFYITKQISQLLPFPFQSNCRNYGEENGGYYKDNKTESTGMPHPYLDNPLSKDDCKIGCLANHTLTVCNCWPPELPFITGFSNPTRKGYNLTGMNACDWTNMTTKTETASQVFTRCFAGQETTCEKNCMKDCL